MKHTVFFLSFNLLLLAACSKKPEAAAMAPAAIAPPPAPQAATPRSPTSADVAHPVQTSPATSSGSAAPAREESIKADDFGVMSKALLTFRRDKQRAPRDWQELISTGYLKQMPAAPAGKRYTFDPRSLDVHVVNGQP